MDYDSADLMSDLVEDLRAEITTLKRKIGDHSGINDIFLSIKDASKILKEWQYQELTITDNDSGEKRIIYIVNEASIKRLKEYRKIIEHDPMGDPIDAY